MDMPNPTKPPRWVRPHRRDEPLRLAIFAVLSVFLLVGLPCLLGMFLFAWINARP